MLIGAMAMKVTRIVSIAVLNVFKMMVEHNAFVQVKTKANTASWNKVCKIAKCIYSY